MHTQSSNNWPSLTGVEVTDNENHMSHLQHHNLNQQPSHQQTYMAPGSSRQQQPQQQQHNSRPGSKQGSQQMNLQSTGLDIDYATMMPNHWQMHLQHVAQQQRQEMQQRQHHQQQHQQHQQQHHHQAQQQHFNFSDLDAFNAASFASQFPTSSVEFMPNTTTAADAYSVPTTMDNNFMTMAGPMESMNALVFPLNDYQNDLRFQMGLNNAATLNHQSADSVNSSIPGGSPTGNALEVQSLSDNEGSWSMVNFNTNHRQSFDSYSSGTVSNPSQNLHIRTNSVASSDGPSSAELSGSFEDVPRWPLGPTHDFHDQDYLDAQYLQNAHGLAMTAPQRPSPSAVSPKGTVDPTSYRSSGSGSSSSTSPSSSGPLSPPTRRRKSPLEKTAKAGVKKTQPPGSRKDSPSEKKVGRRRGPLRPDQRQQAHEIRKLRACLRCKFLKKTCDKGEPCGGCRPSHARLWQVPCTRMDIKDIAYFMKDWKADFERHVSLGFSVGNIKGFSALERTIYITHGYGHYLPISAREVYVRDEKCFDMDWVETTYSEDPESFGVETAKLSAGIEGISTARLSEYLDRHLDDGFEMFVDTFFEGTKFLTEILKTAYRYYQREKTPSIRKALKLVLAYNLTLHITMAEGLSEEEQFQGKIDDSRSSFHGKTVAPVMINFQVKCALGDMWRDLQKEILEELSSLYSSVYSGEKLKNWPTIFMLAALLLAVWEEMQFDCYYRVPDEKYVSKFCDDMETTPVGVIVGLFQAISTKLPGLQEWDTRKHHHLLGSNPAVCDALTEVRDHVNKYGMPLIRAAVICWNIYTNNSLAEPYLKDQQNAKFDREDFDSLSNKFLSKLVIRAN